MTSVPDSCRFRRVARVVIEFATPFHVGSGRAGDGLDALVVTDSNGLPTIPGSSLAGALRATFAQVRGEAEANEVFGHQEEDSGRGSRLNVSWACIHDQADRPVEGLLDPLPGNDAVLQDALALRHRDHVRLGHRGAAENRGKFDERHVSAGHRFTFELELADETPDSAAWSCLLQILDSGELRLGGKTRRGYGAFKMVRLLVASFDLANAAAFDAYALHPASLAKPAAALAPLTPREGAATRPAPVQFTLNLQPRGYWMFGGGDDVDRDNPADMAPLRDARVVWEDSVGRVVENLIVLPATAIKGALAHRVAFHWNRAAGRFADSESTERRPLLGEDNPAVQELFGWKAGGGDGQRGRLLINDTYWSAGEPRQQRVPHVAIDRFTGGASEGKLFDERPVWGGDFPALTLTVMEAHEVGPATRRALHAALEDLWEGRLALGAGGGRGLGYFEVRPHMRPLECTGDTSFFTPSEEPAQP